MTMLQVTLQEQQDSADNNVQCHNNAHVIDWIARFPDLYPMELMLDLLDQRLRDERSPPRTFAVLRQESSGNGSC